MVDAIWRGTNDSIRLVVPRERYSVIPSWDQERRLIFWYINLEHPLRRTAIGFDFLDQILDIIVSPDISTWKWKDEDELSEARIVGLVSDQEFHEIEANGIKAVEFSKVGIPHSSLGNAGYLIRNGLSPNSQKDGTPVIDRY